MVNTSFTLVVAIAAFNTACTLAHPVIAKDARNIEEPSVARGEFPAPLDLQVRGPEGGIIERFEDDEDIVTRDGEEELQLREPDLMSYMNGNIKGIRKLFGRRSEDDGDLLSRSDKEELERRADIPIVNVSRGFNAFRGGFFGLRSDEDEDILSRDVEEELEARQTSPTIDPARASAMQQTQHNESPAYHAVNVFKHLFGRRAEEDEDILSRDVEEELEARQTSPTIDPARASAMQQTQHNESPAYHAINAFKHIFGREDEDILSRDFEGDDLEARQGPSPYWNLRAASAGSARDVENTFFERSEDDSLNARDDEPSLDDLD